MNKKNILETLVLAVVFTSACGKNEMANDENMAEKGYTVPVTVNVTRQGDDATKATYDDGTRKLSFSAGDKLFVSGEHPTVEKFAGALDYDTESGKFSGTITTQNKWTGTADNLFKAASDIEAFLLPAGYESTGYLSVITLSTPEKYDDIVSVNYEQAFALTKAVGVEQLSQESSTIYASGFTLSPNGAILNFTITDLAASTEVAVAFSDDVNSINKSVTTDASGNATFVVGVLGGYTDFKDCNLSINGRAITLGDGSSYALARGKIYNITRSALAAPPGAIDGLFSVSATKQVYFSKGNLQATTTESGISWTWAFAANQWSNVGNAPANNAVNGYHSVSNNGTVDLFGWSTAATYLGIHNSPTSSTYSGDFVEWGSNTDVIAGIGTGWRTLTGGSGGEWEYLFNTRSTTSGIRYAKASVNGEYGVILLPDDWSTSYYPLNSTNTSDAAYTTNLISSSVWTSSLEAHGAVFLPAAGSRKGMSVSNVRSIGCYWSSTPNGDDSARRLYFDSDNVSPNSSYDRYYGYSVRLVKDN